MSGIYLKKCPFCGGNYIFLSRNSDDDSGVVWCADCHASASWRPTVNEAVAAWNRRPHDGHTCGECENRNEGNDKTAWCPSVREIVAYSDAACPAFVAGVADDIDTIDDETGEANARLIAAAPELYEALRLWVEELCENCQAEIGKTCDGKCEAVRKAKAALEKAGGAE